MTDHERIYLQPECCADPDTGRMWCEDDVFTNECDEGAKPTEYVRADLKRTHQTAPANTQSNPRTETRGVRT